MRLAMNEKDSYLHLLTMARALDLDEASTQRPALPITKQTSSPHFGQSAVAAPWYLSQLRSTKIYHPANFRKRSCSGCGGTGHRLEECKQAPARKFIQLNGIRAAAPDLLSEPQSLSVLPTSQHAEISSWQHSTQPSRAE